MTGKGKAWNGRKLGGGGGGGEGAGGRRVLGLIMMEWNTHAGLPCLVSWGFRPSVRHGSDPDLEES